MPEKIASTLTFLKPDLLLQEQPTRRGLLRTLIAAPAAALATHKLILPAQASVTTPADRQALLDAYSCWLDNERRWLAWERAAGDRAKFRMFLDTVSYDSHAAGRFHDPDTPPPSTRAGHVLAAVGCDWRNPTLP